MASAPEQSGALRVWAVTGTAARSRIIG